MGTLVRNGSQFKYDENDAEKYVFKGYDFSINPFLVNVPILYPLKTPENLWFSGVFRGIKWIHWPEVG